MSELILAIARLVSEIIEEIFGEGTPVVTQEEIDKRVKEKFDAYRSLEDEIKSKIGSLD